MPGTVGSELGLTYLVSVNCDWERQPVWSVTGSQCGSPYTCLTLSPPAVQNRSHSKHQLSRTRINFRTPTLLKIHPKSDKEKLFTFQNHLESNWKHFALCPFTALSALHNRRVSSVCVLSHESSVADLQLRWWALLLHLCDNGGQRAKLIHTLQTVLLAC